MTTNTSLDKARQFITAPRGITADAAAFNQQAVEAFNSAIMGMRHGESEATKLIEQMGIDTLCQLAIAYKNRDVLPEMLDVDSVAAKVRKIWKDARTPMFDTTGAMAVAFFISRIAVLINDYVPKSQLQYRLLMKSPAKDGKVASFHKFLGAARNTWDIKAA